MEELDELFCGMDDTKLLELLLVDQVAESMQADLHGLQQLVGRQHLLIGVQRSRFVWWLEKSDQFIFSWNAVQGIVPHFLPDVVDDLLLSVGGQKVQQLLLALRK